MMKRFLFFHLVVALAAICSGPAQGADGTWTNLASGQLWSTSGNWSGDTVADGTNFTATFSTLNIISDTTVRVDTVRTIGNMAFGDTDTNSAGSWILDNNGSAGNILALAGTAPTITANALGTNKSATISCVIAGTNGLIKAGIGTLILSGVNTFSNGVTVNGGTLSVGADLNLGAVPGSFQSNNITLNGGTLKVTANITTHANRGILLASGTSIIACTVGGNGAHANIISGPGNVDFLVTGGEYRLQTNNTFTGDTRILGGAYGLVMSEGGGQYALQNSTITMVSNNNDSIFLYNNPNFAVIGGISGSWNLPLDAKFGFPGRPIDLRVGNNNSNTTYSGILRGGGSLTKIGTGTLTMTNAHSFSGTVTIVSGTLAVSTINNENVAGPMGQNTNPVATVTLGTNGVTATLRLTGTSATYSCSRKFTIATGGTGTFQIDNLGTAQTLSGVVDGWGNLMKTGPGTLILSANTYTGNTTVNAGTLGVTNSLSSTSSVYVATGSIMALNFAGANTINSLYLGGAAQSPGMYGSTASGSSYFTGSGFLNVTNGPPPAGMVISIH